MIGQTIHKWTIVGRTDIVKNYSQYWLGECGECGHRQPLRQSSISRGDNLKCRNCDKPYKYNKTFDLSMDRPWTELGWNNLIWYLNKGYSDRRIAKDLHRDIKDIRQKIEIIKEARKRRVSV